jgi:uncharacterized membrane protein YfcA
MGVGVILGTLAGLGVGGGSLLMIWLTLVLNTPYPEAKITNLLFFLPGAVIATHLRIKGKTISINRIWPAILAGCAGALLAYMLGQHIRLSLLKKLFGVLLLITGIRELLYRPRKAK